MKEKKMLSVKELEDQTALELPDRQLLDVEVNQAINIAVFILTLLYIY